MTNLSLTDILGPIMVGPSSSHTAGALRIAAMARQLCHSRPVSVEFFLFGSFAHTHMGHGSDKALVAGIMGLEPDDLRIRESFKLAEEAHLSYSFIALPDATNFDHPNTIDIRVIDDLGNTVEVRGESIGGGAAVIRKINDIEVYITGENTSIVVRQHDQAGVLAHIAYSLSVASINIATTRMYREHRGTTAYTILETDQAVSDSIKAAIETHPGIYNVRIIPSDNGSAGSPTETLDSNMKQDNENSLLSEEMIDEALQRFDALDFTTGANLLSLCEQERLCISELYLAREKALSTSLGNPDSSLPYLARVLEVMRESATHPMTNPLPSMGGLIGGESYKLHNSPGQQASLGDKQLLFTTAYAMAVLETNASMGRIVAAPTAGSAGVVPAVLLALQDTHGFSDEEVVRGLATAGAIGHLITRNATVSGAEGGCQAEVGSAAAMAAAAAVQLAGGTPEQCLNAAGNALTSLMGLVCDPVAGLVEVPCQKRNASGAATALVSAQIALADIGNFVDFDQTVEAMAKVGHSLPFELRESALGGLAATPTACAYHLGCAGCSSS